VSDLEQRQRQTAEKRASTNKRLTELEEKQRLIQIEYDKLTANRNQYTVVSDIVDLLEKLEKMGGEKLFWGDSNKEISGEIFSKVNATLSNYDEKVKALAEKRDWGVEAVDDLAQEVHDLAEQEKVLEEVAEEAQHDFVIEREMVTVGYRPLMMPWTSHGEDEKRFKKILLITIFLTVLLGYLIPLWDIPLPDKSAVVEIPERLAKLILKKQEPPPPKELPKAQDKLQKKKDKKTKSKKPTDKTTKVARKRAETAGLLAFKKNFSELISSDVAKKLGAKARISSLGKTAKRAQRSIITAQSAAGASGGINTAALSRDVGGSGKGIKGVGFSRVESAIGTDFAGEERPLSEGVGPSRTDEEIQIVFDRYKSALYRIYNKQLRKNPALQGKMVLLITIEPNGSVSGASVESSDMDSAELDNKIVARVKRFNFGPKDGVPTITIRYPIDFLPAS